MQSFSKRLLVVDTWVFGCFSDCQHLGQVLQLLGKILSNCHSIVLDYDEDIFEEYRRHFDKAKFLHQWYREMLSKGKITHRPMQNLPLNIYLGNGDKKLVNLAASTPDRIVITGDSDLIDNKTHSDFVSHGIAILSLEEACAML